MLSSSKKNYGYNDSDGKQRRRLFNPQPKVLTLTSYSSITQPTFPLGNYLHYIHNKHNKHDPSKYSQVRKT